MIQVQLRACKMVRIARNLSRETLVLNDHEVGRNRSYKGAHKPKIPGMQMASCFNSAAMHRSILTKMERSPHLPSHDDLKTFNFMIIFCQTS